MIFFSWVSEENIYAKWVTLQNFTRDKFNSSSRFVIERKYEYRVHRVFKNVVNCNDIKYENMKVITISDLKVIIFRICPVSNFLNAEESELITILSSLVCRKVEAVGETDASAI